MLATTRPRINAVTVTVEPLAVRAEVRLDLAGRELVGRAETAPIQLASARAAAEATIAALRPALTDARVVLEDVSLDLPEGDARVTALVAVATRQGTLTHVGAALVRDDVVQAAVRATLDALNRRLPTLLADTGATASPAEGARDASGRAAQPDGADPDDDAGPTEDAGDDLVGIASHQLRGPVGVLLGYLQTLSERWSALEDDTRHDMVERSVQQGQRLVQRLENLLSLAATATGELPTHVDTVPIRDVVEQAVKDVTRSSGTVIVDVPDDLLVRADPDHASQIVANFVDNALRHGRPPVMVSADRRGDRVEVAVVDHGPGIPPGLYDDLFDRQQRDRTETSGTGLGLFITRLLAEANGGSVHLDRDHTPGTRLIVELPAAAGNGHPRT